MDHFRRTLNSIAKRPDVDAIWMQIYETDETDWPFSENVLIVGRVPLADIHLSLNTLQPSEVGLMRFGWTPSRAPDLFGREYINLWWD